MPVHVEEMTSEVGVLEGELPLSPEQLERLVRMVIKRLEQQQREGQLSRDDTSLRDHSAPPAPGEE